MIQPLLIFSDWGILILRVVLGVVLIVHGWPKVKNLHGTGEAFQGMGFKPGVFWATVAAALEFLGGLMLVLGLFTQIIALLVAIQFLVIILKLKLKPGAFAGYEFDLLILGAALLLLTIGGGAVSLDTLIGILIY